MELHAGDVFRVDGVQPWPLLEGLGDRGLDLVVRIHVDVLIVQVNLNRSPDGSGAFIAAKWQLSLGLEDNGRFPLER